MEDACRVAIIDSLTDDVATAAALMDVVRAVNNATGVFTPWVGGAATTGILVSARR